MKLPRSFYMRPALTVARELLGAVIVRRVGRKLLKARIVEVEAYCGERDPASHAYHGMTERNRVMFGRGGFLYVYFTYGMHFCANVVANEEGTSEAVLIRGVEPLMGIEVMAKNRGIRKMHRGELVHTYTLTNGPAKFAQAFGIARTENGTDLTGTELYLERGEPVGHGAIVRSVRIGISVAKDKPWRFFLKGNPWVSRA